jgi:hypothetical protein
MWVPPLIVEAGDFCATPHERECRSWPAVASEQQHRGDGGDGLAHVVVMIVLLA